MSQSQKSPKSLQLPRSRRIGTALALTAAAAAFVVAALVDTNIQKPGHVEISRPLGVPTSIQKPGH